MGIKAKLEAIYIGYKFYGIYYRKSDGRAYVVRAKPGSRKNKKSSMLLSRAKMEVKLGRKLGHDEEVDHHDNNKLNDSYSNLRLLSKDEHRRKTAKEALGPKTASHVKCPGCKRKFLCPWFRIRNAKDKDRQACCSRSCSSKIYGSNQYG